MFSPPSTSSLLTPRFIALASTSSLNSKRVGLTAPPQHLHLDIQQSPYSDVQERNHFSPLICSSQVFPVSYNDNILLVVQAKTAIILTLSLSNSSANPIVQTLKYIQGPTTSHFHIAVTLAPNVTIISPMDYSNNLLIGLPALPLPPYNLSHKAQGDPFKMCKSNYVPRRLTTLHLLSSQGKSQAHIGAYDALCDGAPILPLPTALTPLPPAHSVPALLFLVNTVPTLLWVLAPRHLPSFRQQHGSFTSGLCSNVTTQQGLPCPLLIKWHTPSFQTYYLAFEKNSA